MPNKLWLLELRRIVAAEFFPNRCPFCGEIIGAIRYYCDACYRHLPFSMGKSEPPPNISQIYACCLYTRRVRKAVHMLKFSGLIYPADTFALMMSRMLENVDADVLIPVPSGRRSVRKRGFSTAKLLTKRISIRLGIPMVNAVNAYSDKEEQKTLSVKARYENAKRSFYLTPRNDVRGKRVLLIDDVSTTGSTLAAIAGLLREAGAVDISAAVFAKTPDFVRHSGEHKLYRIVRRDKEKGENNA